MKNLILTLTLLICAGCTTAPTAADRAEAEAFLDDLNKPAPTGFDQSLQAQVDLLTDRIEHLENAARALLETEIAREKEIVARSAAIRSAAENP